MTYIYKTEREREKDMIERIFFALIPKLKHLEKVKKKNIIFDFLTKIKLQDNKYVSRSIISNIQPLPL